MGVSDIDNCLMVLAASLDMDISTREIVTKYMIKGFDDHVKTANTVVSGGQSILNPWPIIGGTAKAICKLSEIRYPTNAVSGDVLILTKALGTQCAVNGKQWMNTPVKWEKYSKLLRRDWVLSAYHQAVKSMIRLNRVGAQLMHKYDSHAATDVTGFGILGHAENLASNQVSEVDFIIHTLPVIKYMYQLNQTCHDFKLLSGYSAETSGGLLICMEKANAEKFIQEIEEIEGEKAWIVGEVVAGTRKASVATNPTIIEY